MKDKRIGMLMGGHNAEHEVSISSGKALARALRNRGYQVCEVVVDKNLPYVLKREHIEVAFVALHGRWGEDGCVQGLLETMRIPYTGSGVLASALSMNKVFAKRIFRMCGLAVVEDLILSPGCVHDFKFSDLLFDLPVVIKPCCEGSSVGVSIVSKREYFHSALEQACNYAGGVLIEPYVPGREIHVAVLEDKPLGAIEVVPGEEFYNYKAKYHSNGKTRYIFPAPLSKQEHENVLAIALDAHRALGCRGVSRVDTILDDRGKFWLLELNTMPGMTEVSLVPKIAAGQNISFEELAEHLLYTAALKA